LVDLPMLQEAITPCTILISIMHANNEVGTIEPIAAITELARRSGILVHTDCAQSVGKIPVHVDDLGVDLLTVAGHKLHAPKGVGALYIREGVRLERLIHGAGQEMGWRAGTENVIHAVGLGEACAIVSENLPVYREHMREMRDRFEAALCRQLPDLRVNGHPVERLPNTSSISFKGLSATRLLDRLDRVAASAGAACHSDQIAVSHVLQAMQVPMDYALGTVRFSVGRATTGEEIDSAAAEVANAVRELRGGGQRSIW
jgi:cysteine desulfurase